MLGALSQDGSHHGCHIADGVGIGIGEVLTACLLAGTDCIDQLADHGIGDGGAIESCFHIVSFLIYYGMDSKGPGGFVNHPGVVDRNGGLSQEGFQVRVVQPVFGFEGLRFKIHNLRSLSLHWFNHWLWSLGCLGSLGSLCYRLNHWQVVGTDILHNRARLSILFHEKGFHLCCGFAEGFSLATIPTLITIPVLAENNGKIGKTGLGFSCHVISFSV